MCAFQNFCSSKSDQSLLNFPSFPDEQAGELPLAYVVKREHVDLTEAEVMSFVARIVRLENSNIGMNAIPIILEYCIRVLL